MPVTFLADVALAEVQRLHAVIRFGKQTRQGRSAAAIYVVVGKIDRPHRAVSSESMSERDCTVRAEPGTAGEVKVSDVCALVRKLHEDVTERNHVAVGEDVGGECVGGGAHLVALES